MRVLIAFGNQLVTDGLKDLLCKSDRKIDVKSICTTQNESDDEWKDNDVVITDYLSLARVPKECFEDSKVLIMDNGLSEETIVSLYLTEHISGIIPADAEIDTFLKAIQVVHNGEVWINNAVVKTLLNQKMTRKVRDVAKFTERETAIVRLVKQGYRNKEIADFLSISEQTVKSHLNRVFRKLNVTSRTELLARASELSI
ncbi:MAG: response regulator transcription factor [Nitrospirota bacterium]|nr:response regulator transcription factor [Nitrospirota bacterium]